MASKYDLSKQERKANKAKRKLEKQLIADRKKYGNIDINEDAKVNILCVRFGTKYSIEYVQRLRNMVERHLTVPYNFYCLTDDHTPIQGVTLINQPNQGYAKGWWHKVQMFNPVLPIRGRILYMDLDVVICRNIDKLATTFTTDFLGIRDFNRKFHSNWKYLNSSVMSWNHGTQSHIYRQFMEAPKIAMKLHGDQDWIWKTSKNIIKFWPEKWIQSYKWEIRSREELHMIHNQRLFKTVNNDVNPDKECCIAVFHGEPNPAQVQDKFVVDNWK